MSEWASTGSCMVETPHKNAYNRQQSHKSVIYFLLITAYAQSSVIFVYRYRLFSEWIFVLFRLNISLGLMRSCNTLSIKYQKGFWSMWFVRYYDYSTSTIDVSKLFSPHCLDGLFHTVLIVAVTQPWVCEWQNCVILFGTYNSHIPYTLYGQ